jgi:hypothetical protein
MALPPRGRIHDTLPNPLLPAGARPNGIGRQRGVEIVDQHGLLLPKSAHGSACKREDFGKVLAGHCIPWLLSPPCLLGYNRGCGAAGGAIAWRRPAAWANGVTRRQGYWGPTPVGSPVKVGLLTIARRSSAPPVKRKEQDKIS